MKENKQVAALCPEEIDETFDENHYVKITDENVKILSEHRLKNNDVDSRAIRALTHKDLSFDDMTNLMCYRDAKETENDYRFQVAVTEDEMIYVNEKRYFYKHSCYDGMQDFEIYDYVNVTAEENKLIEDYYLKKQKRYFEDIFKPQTIELVQLSPEINYQDEAEIDEFLSEIELDCSDDENVCPVHFDYRCTTINQLIKITNEIKKLSLENEQVNIVSNEYGLVYQFSTYVDIEKWKKFLGGVGIKALNPVPFNLDLLENNGMEVEYDIPANFHTSVNVKSAEHQLVEQYLAGEILKGTLKRI